MSDSGAASARVVNAMTVDVEDYYQVSAFESTIDRDRWETLESRVCRNTDRLLTMFERFDVSATFFVLGWVAERFPALVRRIAAAGHEIASHGYAHRLVYDMVPDEFRLDVRKSKIAIEDACGAPVLGFRAASYSITQRSLWALEVLAEEQFVYDTSIYPIHHDRYGIPDAPRFPYRIEDHGHAMWELPGSTVRIAGQNVPIGGGGYFRLFPYGWTRRAIHHVNIHEQRPVIFYIHPWEIDTAQPRMAAPLVSQFRHYHNLEKTEWRLGELLRDFAFGPISQLLAGEPADRQLAGSPAGV